MTMTMEPQVLKEVGRAPEDFLLLEARQEGLLTLIGELLQQNEELRMKVARLEGHAAHTRTSC